jgi:hypothetical protein
MSDKLSRIWMFRVAYLRGRELFISLSCANPYYADEGLVSDDAIVNSDLTPEKYIASGWVVEGCHPYK